MKKLIIGCVIFLMLLVPMAHAWETERPAGEVHFDEGAYNRNTDGLAAIGLGVGIGHYTEDDT